MAGLLTLNGGPADDPSFLADRPTEAKQESGGAVLVLSVAKR